MAFQQQLSFIKHLQFINHRPVSGVAEKNERMGTRTKGRERKRYREKKTERGERQRYREKKMEGERERASEGEPMTCDEVR